MKNQIAPAASDSNVLIAFDGDYALDKTTSCAYRRVMTTLTKARTKATDELTLISIMQRFSSEEAARDYVESQRWPNGPVCPHCGNCDKDHIYKITANAEKKIRAGLFKCAECNDQFTVTIGTVMEDSHIPLNKWLIGFYILCASQTQVSALQLQRQLEIGSYRSAWFLRHRIRFSLVNATPSDLLRGTVETDEAYIGSKKKGRSRGHVGNKTAVVSLVERDVRVRSQVVEKVGGKGITRILKRHVSADARLNTDQSRLYRKIGSDFASHEVVNSGREECSGDDRKTGRRATTNVVDGFFGNSKRALDGTHHHISKKHATLYFAALDYKYNTHTSAGGQRTALGIKSIGSKRLMLRRPLASVKAQQ